MFGRSCPSKEQEGSNDRPQAGILAFRFINHVFFKITFIVLSYVFECFACIHGCVADEARRWQWILLELKLQMFVSLRVGARH